MMYLAIPSRVVEWVRQNSERQRALAIAVANLDTAKITADAVYVEGAFRIAVSVGKMAVITVWNTNLIRVYGEEQWFAIRLTGECGLLGRREVAHEVLERALHVSAQRLDKLLVPPEFFVRSRPGGVFTCIAGRGTEARQYRIAYVERNVEVGGYAIHGVVVVGPEREDDGFRRTAADAADDLADVCRLAGDALQGRATKRELRAAPSSLSQLAGAPLGGARVRDSQAAGNVATLDEMPSGSAVFSAIDWTYEDWMAPDSTLTAAQRLLIESDVVGREPVRVVGAAGTGKTLVLMLLAVHQLRLARKADEQKKILYVTHNNAMRDAVWMRLVELGAEDFLDAKLSQVIEVQTLAEYSRRAMNLSELHVIDRDASDSKAYQRELLCSAALEVVERVTLAGSVILQGLRDEETSSIFVDMLVDEISIAIKGLGLQDDRRHYVESSAPLSRLHRALSHSDRGVVFDIFEVYHRTLTVRDEVLDSDDIAISMVYRLSTPLWTMQRTAEGYDLVIVDEAHLFNDNERKIFPRLTRVSRPFIPVVLALDDAQQTQFTQRSGLGLIGYDGIRDRQFDAVFRSSPEILRLAFYIVQRTTDLFGPDFPNFTVTTIAKRPVGGANARPMLCRSPAGGALGQFVAAVVRKVRAANYRQVAVVCHLASLWDEVYEGLHNEPGFLELNRRGERIDQQHPVVAIAAPEYIGGQEFDAVVCVGLEKGCVPAEVKGSLELSLSLEQQALREMYVAFTRAREKLYLVVREGYDPNAAIADALFDGIVGLSSGAT